MNSISNFFLVFSIAALGVVLINALVNYLLRKAVYKRLAAALKGSEQLYYPIRYASERRFNKFWKIFPWERAGLLVMKEPGTTLFRYIEPAGEVGEMVLTSAKDEVEWAGTVLKNGFTHWFSIREGGTTHYFSSETGVFIVNSESTTREIYNRIRG